MVSKVLQHLTTLRTLICPCSKPIRDLTEQAGGVLHMRLCVGHKVSVYVMLWV